MQPLKLIALDEEDLAVVSSHLQDAVVRVGDMVYQPSKKRFAAVLNRFDWESAQGGNGKDFKRRRTALRWSPQDVLRIGVHPSDCRHSTIMKSIEKTMQVATRNRRAGRYADLQLAAD